MDDCLADTGFPYVFLRPICPRCLLAIFKSYTSRPLIRLFSAIFVSLPGRSFFIPAGQSFLSFSFFPSSKCLLRHSRHPLPRVSRFGAYFVASLNLFAPRSYSRGHGQRCCIFSQCLDLLQSHREHHFSSITCRNFLFLKASQETSNSHQRLRDLDIIWHLFFAFVRVLSCC